MDNKFLIERTNYIDAPNTMHPPRLFETQLKIEWVGSPDDPQNLMNLEQSIKIIIYEPAMFIWKLCIGIGKSKNRENRVQGYISIGILKIGKVKYREIKVQGN